MARSNLKALINREKPPHLQGIEAAIKNGSAAHWSAAEVAEARAYIDRVSLSLERKYEKDMQKPLKVAKFKGFARDLPRGTSLSELASAAHNMRSQELGRGRIVPSIKAIVTFRLIKHLSEIQFSHGKEYVETSREEVPVRVRSAF